MTIQSQVYDISYTGNGATTVFAYNFRILANTDLKVYVDGTLKTLTTHYTVSGVGSDSGGNVTFLSAPLSNTAIYIARSGMALTQLADYVENDDFPAETHETALDKATMLIQQTKLITDKCLKLPASDTSATTLDSAVLRANTYLGFDGDGDAAYYPIDEMSVPVDTFLQAGTGAVARTYQAKNRDIVNAKDFGCVGDGVTDDTTNLIKAVTYCKSAHKTLSLEGCICLVSSTIDVTGVTVDGGGRGMDGYGGAYDAFPNIKATSAQFNILTTTGSTTLRDLTIHGSWDGVTAGQNGYGIYADYQGYDLDFQRIRVIAAKKSGIYLNCAGYTTLYDVKVYACGLHGLEIFGNTINDAATTVSVGGFSVFTGMANGVGVKLTNAINCNFTDCIAEGNSSGISLNGDNRNLKFDSFYQENITDTKFLTWNSSSGIGLIVTNCFYPNGTIDAYTGWLNVHFIGNTMSTPPIWASDTGRVMAIEGGEVTRSTTGSYTAVTINLARGTWWISASVQTVNASSGELNRIACQITSNAADSGENTTTANGTYNHLAAVVNANTNTYYEPPVNPLDSGDLPATFTFEEDTQTSAMRLHIAGKYDQTATGDVYLRVYTNVHAGSVGVNASVHAFRISES
jgi:hypothetical protein